MKNKITKRPKRIFIPTYTIHTHGFVKSIHQPKMCELPLTKTQIEALSGFVEMRVFGVDAKKYGVDNSFILLKFEVATYGDIENIQSQLKDYFPVYCFSEICPNQHKGCPAWRL